MSKSSEKTAISSSANEDELLNQRLKKLFSRLDCDGNGKIDIKDLSSALKGSQLGYHYAEVCALTLSWPSFSRASKFTFVDFGSRPRDSCMKNSWALCCFFIWLCDSLLYRDLFSEVTQIKAAILDWPSLLSMSGNMKNTCVSSSRRWIAIRTAKWIWTKWLRPSKTSASKLIAVKLTNCYDGELF